MYFNWEKVPILMINEDVCKSHNKIPYVDFNAANL